MTDYVTFFDSDDVKRSLVEASRTIDLIDNSSADSKKMADMLKLILGFILRNAEDFDVNCQLNINWIGHSISDAFRSNNLNVDRMDVEGLLVIFYRFVTEYDLSTEVMLPFDLQNYQDYVKSIANQLSPNNQRMVAFTDQQLSIKMVKALIHDGQIGDFRSFPSAAEKIREQVNGWDQLLSEKMAAVKKLEESLERYKVEFNFLAFDVGFGNLSKNTAKALFWSRIGMAVFGVLLPIPLIIELFFIYSHRADMAEINSTFLISSAAISFSLTLLLIYFFRIVLVNSESCKSQILQLDLRRELCRFVQEYVGYAEALKGKSPDALAKFETLIFSGITMNNDQSVSMFDGIDKISDLIKSYKSQ